MTTNFQRRCGLFGIALGSLLLALPGVSQATTLYALSNFNSTNQLHTIDSSNANATFVGNVSDGFGFGLGDSNGRLFGFNQSTNLVEEIDPATGAVVDTFNVGISTGGEGAITFNSSGTGFLSQSSGTTGTLWDFDITGLSNTLIDSTLTPSMDGMDFNSSNVLYGLSQSSGVLYTIDTTNGDTTLVGSTGINPGIIAGLTFDNQDNLFAITSGGLLYSLDASNGNSSLIGDTGLSDVSGLSALSGAAVPEPLTVGLLGLGLAGLGLSRRRKPR